jgi:beta-glucosidase
VQLYVSHLGSKVERARQELKGFQRIAIQPNQTKTVTMTVKAEDLAYWDEKQNKWVVEEDQVKVMAGPSSAQLTLAKTIEVTAK